MLFDSTLRRDLSRTFGATLVVILTIVLTMLLIRVVGLAAKGQVSPQDVALLLGYLTLGQLPLMLILSLFIAVVATLGRMYRESEMAIWFASGVGIRRFVRPVLRMSVPVLVFIAVLTMFVWPWGNQNSSELRARYEKRSDLSRVAPGQFQSSSDGRRVFFIDRSREDEHKAANVFILQSEADTESVTSARSGSIEDRDGDSVLVLQRGQRNEADRKTGEKTLSRFETYSIVVGEREMSRLDKPPPRPAPPSTCCARARPKHRANSPGVSAWCWAGPTSCCWASAWPPPARARRTTGTCCSHCWLSSCTST